MLLSVPVFLTALLSATAVSAQPNRLYERELDDIVGVGNVGVGELERRTVSKTKPTTYAPNAGPCPADHANWESRNAQTWWKVDATQQDHARFHAYLSMAAYGDYATECPKTFPGNFTLIQKFSAKADHLTQAGFVAKIPSMNKVVLIFEGNDFETIDYTPVSIEDLVADCKGCEVAKTVKDLYVAARKATNNFATFKSELAQTKLLSSVTGHSIGGAVAILAGLDLGSKGHMEYSHNQGVPRVFNHAAIYRYDRLFEGEAGQSLISRNDYAALYKEEGPYCHVGQKAHITGNVDQWFTNCYGWNENSTCLGNGSSKSDHTYYFTPKGQCGSVNKGF